MLTGTKMKKILLFICMAAGLLSCAKEILTPGEGNAQSAGIPMTFNVTVDQTKAHKTDWVDGDRIYVFFNGLETKYLMLERISGSWAKTSGGGTLLDTDFSGLGAKTFTAVHLPVATDVTYANGKFSITSGGKPVYNYYLRQIGEAYTVDGTTVTATISLVKRADIVRFHVADIQANVSEYTFGCSKVRPVACKSIDTSGAITEDILQAGARLNGVAEADGGVFAGRLTNPGVTTDYVFTVASNDNLYTLTRTGRALSSGITYNFPSLSNTGGSNWTVTPASDLYVDMGIEEGGKTIYWAKCNLGADTETGYGNFYAWGEIQPKDTFNTDWSNYVHGHADNALTKYCTQSSKGKDGYVDNLTTLEPVDDAAYAAFGGKFRMPTREELNALQNTKSDANYTWTWCDGSTERYNDSDVTGWKVVRKSTGATLFLPACGYKMGTTHSTAGKKGYLWSSTLYHTEYPEAAIFLYFSSGSVYNSYLDRNTGRAIRPVYTN